MPEQQTFNEWALVELFGHQRIAGEVSEQQIGGASFVRVDVPATLNQATYTRFFGAAAIYSITPLAREIVLRLAVNLQAHPVQRWELQLPAPPERAEAPAWPNEASGDEPEHDDNCACHECMGT